MDEPGKVCKSCMWPAEEGKLIFSCPRSHLRIWFRDTGSAIPSRASPELIGSRSCAPMASTTYQESIGTGPVALKAVPVTGAAFAGHHGPINVRLSFPTPIIVYRLDKGKEQVHFLVSLLHTTTCSRVLDNTRYAAILHLLLFSIQELILTIFEAPVV